MQQWAGDWAECQIGHYNLFLTEAGFQSDLHTDQQHFAFTASMCEGRKRWRIVANGAMALREREGGRAAEEEKGRRGGGEGGNRRAPPPPPPPPLPQPQQHSCASSVACASARA
jgi:hypothetical protein